MILLAYAMEPELEGLAARRDAELLATGVGPVEASCRVATALARQSYRLVVNAGIAGAMDAAAGIGDGVCVSADSMELDLEDGQPIALPGDARTVERAHSDPTLVERLRARGFAVAAGVTVSRVTCTEATAARLARGGARIESMEGFAVLRAAELAGVPAIEVRGISNRVGSPERSGWDFHAGRVGLHRILGALFDVLDEAS